MDANTCRSCHNRARARQARRRSSNYCGPQGLALAALALFVPQLVFVPLMQHAINRRTGARVWLLRQISVGVVAPGEGDEKRRRADDMRIGRVFELNMGIFKLKFTMNFMMNLCNHLEIVGILLVGGWYVYTDQLEIGGVVAFITGITRLNDPWGDLVNYFRDLSNTQVKFRLVANAVNELAQDRPALSETEVKPTAREVMETALPE